MLVSISQIDHDPATLYSKSLSARDFAQLVIWTRRPLAYVEMARLDFFQVAACAAGNVARPSSELVPVGVFTMRNLLLTALVSSFAAVALCAPADAARRSTKAALKQAPTSQYRIVVHNSNPAYYRGNGASGLRDNSRPYFASPPDGPAFFAAIGSG